MKPQLADCLVQNLDAVAASVVFRNRIAGRAASPAAEEHCHVMLDPSRSKFVTENVPERVIAGEVLPSAARPQELREPLRKSDRARAGRANLDVTEQLSLVG